MMIKAYLFLAAVLVLASALCVPAIADTLTVNLDTSPDVLFTPGIPPNPEVPGDPGVPCDFYREGIWNPGTEAEVLQSVQTDPRLRQNILNNTATDVWTDWHVDITWGTNLRGILIYNYTNGTAPIWQYEAYSNAGGVGFFAHLISSGNPNNPMAIDPGERIWVEFTYDVMAGHTASILQYPTTTYNIPEPSSILALLGGMSAFGLAAFRKIRKH
jgi:hypothetical protein